MHYSMNATEPSFPASVGILTLNSAKGLPECIKSVAGFDDIFICDGNSSDGTQGIARSLGARVIRQFDTDEPQPITNFGDACTKCMNASKHEWYLRLDSDERMSPEAISEIRAIVTDPDPKYRVYKTPRKYVWRGTIIDDTVAYPNNHIRFFRRDAVERWGKISHEKIIVKEGESIGMMRGAMLVPMPDTYEQLDAGRFKRAMYWDRLQYEATLTPFGWLYSLAHSSALIARFLVRLFRVRLISRGTKLPLRYDLWRIKYQIATEILSTRIMLEKLFGMHRQSTSPRK